MVVKKSKKQKNGTVMRESGLKNYATEINIKKIY